MDRSHIEMTTTNTAIRMTSAMGENAKMQCLSNDLVRRLLNTSMELPNRYREDVVDKHGIKLLTSGYSMEQVRRILLGGMKGYVSKKRRRPVHGRRRIHNTLEESLQGRIKKKLLGRTSWYKKRGSKEKQNLKKIQGGALKTTSGCLRKNAPLCFC